MGGGWERVTKAKPCAHCGKPDWCTRSLETGMACCMRVESLKQCRNGGWLHDDPSRRTEKRFCPPVRPPANGRVNLAMLMATFQAAGNARVAEQAALMGLRPEVLASMGAGWDGEALAVPMFNDRGTVVGIRRRFPTGQKLAVYGGHEGVFMVRDGLQAGSVVICEGFSDTAAVLGIGLQAIGRPSCAGGERIVASLVAGRKVVIVPDNDDPGIRGARRLMSALARTTDSVRMLVPPCGFKDAREWVRSGATRKDFLTEDLY